MSSLKALEAFSIWLPSKTILVYDLFTIAKDCSRQTLNCSVKRLPTIIRRFIERRKVERATIGDCSCCNALFVGANGFFNCLNYRLLIWNSISNQSQPHIGRERGSVVLFSLHNAGFNELTQWARMLSKWSLNRMLSTLLRRQKGWLARKSVPRPDRINRFIGPGVMSMPKDWHALQSP